MQLYALSQMAGPQQTSSKKQVELVKYHTNRRTFHCPFPLPPSLSPQWPVSHIPCFHRFWWWCVCAGMLVLLAVSIIPVLVFLAVFLEYAPLFIAYDWSSTACEYRIDSVLIPYLITTGYLSGTTHVPAAHLFLSLSLSLSSPFWHA